MDRDNMECGEKENAKTVDDNKHAMECDNEGAKAGDDQEITNTGDDEEITSAGDNNERDNKDGNAANPDVSICFHFHFIGL